ncbi:MAG: TolC family protein [Deltaproteobacteria bacterium]|nr:TolC family protein [Deltaproteobacteria bacterium]
MTSRILFAAALAASTAAPSFAQPAPAPQRPAPPPTPAVTARDEDVLAAFERDLDALFLSSGLTSEQAASRAAGASPAVRRRAAELEAAIASAEAAELTRVPQVSLKASYTRLSPLDPFVIGPGAQIEFLNNSYVGTASVGVPLSDYVLRYPKLIDAARLATQTTKISKRSSEVNAGQDARVAYYEWVRAKLQVMIARRQLTQVQTTLVQVRALAGAQRLNKADLMRVESQEASAELVLDQLQNLAQLREEQLRLLIGAHPTESLAIGEDIRHEVAAPPAQNLDLLAATARAQRLEFRVLDTGIRAKELQRESENANRYPKLSAFLQADYARPNPRIFPQADEFNFTWAAGLQLTWSLNDNLITKTTDRRLAAETNELRADRDNLERGTRIELMAAQQAVSLAQRSLSTSQKGLVAAEESYRVRRALLAAERATAVEIVDAETELTRSRIASLNARVDLRLALTQLSHATGGDTK